jgi:catechol 2,3-dioxygenase-like lactoylglutathione lyase family enzyme
MVWPVTADGPPLSAPITGLSHVQLLVSDLRASARWYTAALGLEPQAEDESAGYIALRHRGARVVVVLTSADCDTNSGNGSGAEGRQMTGGQGGLDHLAFAVPDGSALRAWADHLSAMGVRHDGVVLENGNPSLQLRDPDGNAIELVAPGGPRA